MPDNPAIPNKPGPARKPKTHLPPWVTLLGAVVVIALAWFGWVKTHPADTTGQIITGTVKKGDLIETVTRNYRSYAKDFKASFRKISE